MEKAYRQARLLQRYREAEYRALARVGSPPFKIRIAPEIEACMPVDSEPKPTLPPHILQAAGFTHSAQVEVEVNRRKFVLVTDASVACEHGFMNCEYVLRDDDIVMYTPRETGEVERLFDDIAALWREKKLQEGINQTDSMHVHVSLYDDHGPMTTTTHPFLEFFLQTIFVREGVLQQWAEKLNPTMRQTQPALPMRIAPFNDFYPRFDLNVKPIGDDRYADVKGNQRHIHVEFRSMSSFHRLNKQQFVRYMQLIYELMERALSISSDVGQWEDVLGSKRVVVDIHGAGVQPEASGKILLAEAAGYTVNTIDPDE